jgi:hypothetical protein
VREANKSAALVGGNTFITSPNSIVSGNARGLPKIHGTSDAVRPTSALPCTPDARVELKDLTWEDKERVLKLLFAKINHAQTRVEPLPPHPLEAAATGRS